MTTTNNKANLIEMFADATAGESYSDNRLITRETDGGNVALIAYGWMKLAEYDERRDVITLFEGHRDVASSVSRYLNDVIRTAGERRRIVRTGESPVVGKPNKGAKYIDDYINFSGGLSKVERSVLDEVVGSLRWLSQ